MECSPFAGVLTAHIKSSLLILKELTFVDWETDKIHTNDFLSSLTTETSQRVLMLVAIGFLRSEYQAQDSFVTTLILLMVFETSEFRVTCTSGSPTKNLHDKYHSRRDHENKTCYALYMLQFQQWHALTNSVISNLWGIFRKCMFPRGFINIWRFENTSLSYLSSQTSTSSIESQHLTSRVFHHHRPQCMGRSWFIHSSGRVIRNVLKCGDHLPQTHQQLGTIRRDLLPNQLVYVSFTSFTTQNNSKCHNIHAHNFN